MIRLLRRLVRFIPRLPSQAAFALYNYMVGYVMLYTRNPQQSSQEYISAALSILWTVVPSIQGILFKDIKQIFRKEQCETALLVTANVPSEKKIEVVAPGELDVGAIPSQFPIQEDTQFCQILQESLDFFGIPENDHKSYFLVDEKTKQIHNLQSYVRDFYFFKRSPYPKLQMIKMDIDIAYDALQKQAFTLKLLEIGKVLMSWSILKRPDQVAQRVFFLHEELTKLPSFPRKALEADFNLYKGGVMGKELRGLDQLHKYMWVQLVTRMFEGMAGNLTYTTDLHLFLNVINGAFLLHCEDSSMLRLCMAAYVNAAHHFKNFFSTNGYIHIMPTILRVYSNYQSNKMVVTVVEFIVKQLYILHRKPFILQMLGSVAPILDMDENAIYGDANKIQPQRLFDILLSLERHHEDPLHILDLVTVDKPLKALDFCYHEESDSVTLLEAVDMCVTVVAYSADSKRGHQMLTILEAILGLVLRHLQATAGRDLRQEKETIHHIAVAMKTLITNSEPLAKNYTGPQKSAGEGKGSSRVTYSKASKAYNPAIEVDDDSHSKYMSDSKRYQAYERDIEDSEALRCDFRQPRDTLLNVVAEFLTTCSLRLADINKKSGQESKHSDLLDTKSHLRLAEVAHSLLKVAPYDPATMGCRGLQRYMNEILPHPDWSHEDLRPALVNILRRLDKMFNKIAKKYSIRRLTDWGAAASLLKGVYSTLSKYPYIAHLPHLKMVVQVCQSLILGERTVEMEGHSVAALSHSPPPHFCSMVVKIIAMQILALGVTYSLEQICGGSSLFPTSDKTENMIMNLLLPLCLRVGCGRKDAPKMRQADISFALTVVLHAMNPPLAKIAPQHGPQTKTMTGSDPRSQSWSHQQLDPRAYPKVKPSILRISFLGLKVMMVCFEKNLSQDWHRVLHCLKDMDVRGEGGIALWDFLDFVVSFRTPLFIQMRPFILTKLQTECSNESMENYRVLIRERVHGWSLPPPRCRGSLLLDLAHQVKQLKEELITAKISGDQDVRPPALEIQSEISHISRRPRLSYADPPSECPAPSLTSPPFRATGEDSSVSTPTSQGDGARTPGDSQESTRSGVRPRLQRQMAQSRKTFRFRKSKHGQSEAPERQPQVAHIDVEPTRLPPVTGSQIVTEDPALRELSVPLIPEDKFKSQTHGSTKREKPKPSMIQPEPESVSEISNMETSTISGYRESFGGFDMSLQELERLEMQVRTGRYREPLGGPPAPVSRKGSVAETPFHETMQSAKKVDMIHDSSEISSGVVSHPSSTVVPRPVPDRAIHHTQQEYSRTDVLAHPTRHIESTPYPAGHVTYSTVSVGAADIPYTLHRAHATNFTHSGHAPHPASQHASHATHAHHSVHFSDTTQQVPERTSRSPHMYQTSTTSQVPHTKSTSASLQGHTPHPTPPASSSYHHTTRQSQPIHSTLSTQSKQHTAQSFYRGQTAPSSKHVIEAPSHHTSQQPTHSAYRPHTKGMDYTKHIPHTAYYTHDVSSMHPASLPDPTAKTSHVRHQSQTAVTSKPTVHSPPQSVCSVHDVHHSSHSASLTQHSHQPSHQSSHSTTTWKPAKPARSSQPSSQPTVWRHSWTEGEDKEQRVWGSRHEGVGVTETSGTSVHYYEQGKSKPGKDSHHESKSGESTTTGELTSLLRRFDRRTPSEQSLLMVERDEDTLI